MLSAPAQNFPALVIPANAGDVVPHASMTPRGFSQPARRAAGAMGVAAAGAEAG